MYAFLGRPAIGRPIPMLGPPIIWPRFHPMFGLSSTRTPPAPASLSIASQNVTGPSATSVTFRSALLWSAPTSRMIPSPDRAAIESMTSEIGRSL